MSRLRRISFAALMLVTFVSLVHADFGEGIVQLGEYRIEPTFAGSDVLVMDDLMYKLSGYGIELWDFGHPEEPAYIRTVATPVNGGKMMMHNDLLIIKKDSKIVIYDVEDLENPQYLSTLRGEVYEYIDPIFEAPLIRRINFSNAVAIGNSLVNLDCGVHFTVIDISEPADPQVSHSFTLDFESEFLGGKLLVRNDQVIALGLNRSEERSTLFLTYDIVNGELALENSVVGDFSVGVFAGPARAIIHGDEILYSIEGEGICGVDYSDPDNPEWLGEIEVRRMDDPFSPCEMELIGDRLYVPFYRNTEIYDLAEGFRNIQQIGAITYFSEDELDENPFVGAAPLIFTENVVGVRANDDLWVYDVSDPGNIERIRGEALEPAAPKHTVNEIAMLEDVVYISGDANTYLVSIERPEEPERLQDLPRVSTSSSSLLFEEQDVLYVGNTAEQYAYNLDPPDDPGDLGQVPTDEFNQRFIIDIQEEIALGVEDSQLKTFNLRDPLNPELITSGVLEHQPVEGNRFDEITGTYAFENDFYIFGHGYSEDPELFWYDTRDMRNPDDPGDAEFVSSVDFGQLAEGIDMVYSMFKNQELAFLVVGRTYNDGRSAHPADFRLLITDLWFEEILSETPLPFPGKLYVEGVRLFLTNPEYGIRIYDAVNPEEQIEGWYDTPGYLTQIIVNGDMIIAADTHSLQVLRIGNEGVVGEQVSVVPDRFTISECYPNPFNGTVSFSMYLPHSGEVGYRLVDVCGRLVQSGSYDVPNAGYHRRSLDFSSFNSGVYFLNAESGGLQAVKRLVLVK